MNIVANVAKFCENELDCVAVMGHISEPIPQLNKKLNSLNRKSKFKLHRIIRNPMINGVNIRHFVLSCILLDILNPVNPATMLKMTSADR